MTNTRFRIQTEHRPFVVPLLLTSPEFEQLPISRENVLTQQMLPNITLDHMPDLNRNFEK